MEKHQLDLLLRDQDISSADALRIRVCFILLILVLASTLLFAVSYVATGKLSLLPNILLVFTLPCLVFYYFLKKSGGYFVCVALIFYLYTAMGLMKLISTPDYLVDLFMLPILTGGAFLTLKYRHALIMILYMFALYAISAAVVYFFEPFEVVYTNDNYSSIVVGFVVSVLFSGVMFYFFARNYEINSDLLGNALLTLSKMNDDNRLLLNVISHDFRNHVVRILLQIDNSKRLSSDNRQAMALENVESALHQLSDLLGDVQKVRELVREEDSGEARVEFTIDDVLYKLEMVFRLQMYQKNLTFDVAMPASLRLKMNMDVFTHIILANLIGNAIKFSPPDCKIELRTEDCGGRKRLYIGNLATRGQLDNLRRITRGETRLVSTPGTFYERGQGLGISIVKRFCRAYGIRHELAVEEYGEGLVRASTVLEFS